MLRQRGDASEKLSCVELRNKTITREVKSRMLQKDQLKYVIIAVVLCVCSSAARVSPVDGSRVDIAMVSIPRGQCFAP